MNITFYLYEDDARRVDKSTHLNALSVSLSGTFRTPTSILNPTIDVDLTGLSASNKTFVQLTCNYVYITEFDRFYYIVNRVFVSDDIIRFTMSVDVLFSHMKYILAQKCIIERNENTYTPWIEDDRQVFDLEKWVYIKKPTTPTDISSGVKLTTLEWDLYGGGSINDKDFKFAVSVFSEQTNTGLGIGGKQYPPMPVSDLPIIEVESQNGASGKYTMFVTNIAGVNAVIEACTQHADTIGSFVGNIIAFPFALTETAEFTQITSVKVGALQGGVSPSISLLAYPPYNDNGRNKNSSTPPNPTYSGEDFLNYVLLAVWDTDDPTGYLDLEPYTQYEIYLPFIGYVKVDAVNYLGYRIWVFFSTSLKDGQSTMFIYTTSKVTSDPFSAEDCKLIYTGNFKMGIEIPRSSTSKESIEARKLQQGISFAINEVGAVAQVVTGVATENPMMMAKGGLMGVQAVAGFAGNMATMLQSGNIKLGTSDSSASSPLYVYERKTKMVANLAVADIAKMYGLPCKQYLTLSQVSGMTICGEPVLSYGSYSILVEEQDEIRKYMKNGIILPVVTP